MAKQQPTGIQRQCGVTLIEQIMVIVIISVLASIAVPPLRKLLTRNQLQVAQMDFIAALQHARETAVTTGKQTLLCPTHDGSSCGSDNRWDNGWLLAHDTDHDNQPDQHKLLYVGQGYDGKLVIRSNSGRRYVRFQPDGSAGGTNLTLLICRSQDTEPALSVVVANSGRVRGAPATAAQTADCAQAR
jgi:type IV fimbrial biogenesis protein FimT